MSAAFTPSLNGQTDSSLLRAWKAGKAAQGNELLRRHYAAIAGFFSRRIPDVSDDLTQRTFMECTKALGKYRGEASFKGFLLGIARNVLRQYLQSNQRFRHMLEKQDDPDEIRTSLGSVFAKKQEQHLLLLAFGQLSAKQQIVVELFYWHDLNTSTIAEMLEIPLSTVTTRLSRARMKLRDKVIELLGKGAEDSNLVRELDAWTRSLAALGPSPKPPPWLAG